MPNGLAPLAHPEGASFGCGLALFYKALWFAFLRTGFVFEQISSEGSEKVPRMRNGEMILKRAEVL